MDELEHKDGIHSAVFGAIQESQIIYDYLTDISKLVMKFEKDISQDNMIRVTYEVVRVIDLLMYLSDNTLEKLHEIDRLNGIEVGEQRAEVHD